MRKIFYALIVLVILAVGSYKVSFALFSDQAESSNNTFVAATSFPTPIPSLSPTPSVAPTPSPNPNIANHLVVNEVMFDPQNANACGGEGDAEWIEIYNPTISPVNLDTWLVGDTLFMDDLPNVSVPSGGFAVVVSNCSQTNFNSIWTLPIDTIFINLSGALGNGLNNGGEHMRLLNGATLIDAMSYGSNADAFNPSASGPVGDHSLERDPDGVDTNTAADFVDRSSPAPGS